MLVFNEGVPRAGKSYDAVKNHIIPALKKRRHVYARLNGMEKPECRAALAKYCKLEVAELDEFLHHVDTAQVVRTFRCVQEEGTGKWLMPEHLKDALVVIDEVHEFYVADRKQLDPAIEQFFALFGQNGGDGVVLTQWINRCHMAIRARLERKNSFQKLTAVGMKGKYLVTYYHSAGPNKFMKVGSKTETYEAAIFPCYQGYAEGADNTEVYDEGGKNLWAMYAVKAGIFAVVAAIGAWCFITFFTGGKARAKAAETHQVAQPAKIGDGTPGAVVFQRAAAPAQAVKEPDPLEDLNDEQRYVADLSKLGRIRVQALATVGNRVWGWVEWVNASNDTVEALELDQLRGLGFEVDVVPYGVRLKANKHTLVATAWPRPDPPKVVEPRTYNTREAGLPPGVSSLGSVATEGGNPGGGFSVSGAGGVIGSGKAGGVPTIGSGADPMARAPGYKVESGFKSF